MRSHEADVLEERRPGFGQWAQWACAWCSPSFKFFQHFLSFHENCLRVKDSFWWSRCPHLDDQAISRIYIIASGAELGIVIYGGSCEQRSYIFDARFQPFTLKQPLGVPTPYPRGLQGDHPLSHYVAGRWLEPGLPGSSTDSRKASSLRARLGTTAESPRAPSWFGSSGMTPRTTLATCSRGSSSPPRISTIGGGCLTELASL